MRRRKRTDWVVPEAYGVTTVFVGTSIQAGFSSIRLVGSPEANAQALRTAAGAEYQSDIPNANVAFTILRIVGQVHMVITQNTAAATYVLIERIHIGLIDLDTPNTVAFGVDQLIDNDDAEESFLWQRSRTVIAPTGTTPITDAATSHPWYEMIDVRVKRTMEPSVALYYSIQATPITAGGTLANVSFIPLLRTLVRM